MQNVLSKARGTVSELSVSAFITGATQTQPGSTLLFALSFHGGVSVCVRACWGHVVGEDWS